MKIFKALGNVGFYILILPLIILGLVAMIPVFLWVSILALVELIFKKLRKDPVVIMPSYSIRNSHEYPSNESKYRKSFELYIDEILDNVDSAEFSKITISHKTTDGEEVVNIRTTIKSQHGSAKIVTKAIIMNGAYYSLIDPEVAPYPSVIYVNTNGKELRFDIHDRLDIDFLISILSNDFCRSSSGQIWSKRVNGIYIVAYNIEEVDSSCFNPNYGYRAKLSEKRVRKYFFDA